MDFGADGANGRRGRRLRPFLRWQRQVSQPEVVLLAVSISVANPAALQKELTHLSICCALYAISPCTNQTCTRFSGLTLGGKRNVCRRFEKQAGLKSDSSP